jgi:hypothetical protein
VQLYDPVGRTAQIFSETGIRFERVEKSLPGFLISGRECGLSRQGKVRPPSFTLVIGENVLKSLSRRTLDLLDQRIRSGPGATIILAQKSYPLGFPVGLTLNHLHGTSLGFVAAPGHPVFRDLSEENVRMWSSNMSISERDFNLPIGGGYRALIVGGGTGGLLYSPLVEKNGPYALSLFCQLSLVEKIQREPAAALVLTGMLRYAEKCLEARPHHFELEMPRELSESLEQWGIKVENDALLGASAKITMCNAGELSCRPDTLSRVVKKVAGGGVLWLFGVDPASLKSLSPFLPGIALTPLSSEKLPAKFLHHSGEESMGWLTEGLLNQFLYWTEPHADLVDVFAKLLPQTPWVFLEGEASGLHWEKLCDPPMIVAARLGRGIVLLDTLDWTTLVKRRGPATNIIREDENQERAVRLLSGLLSNLGAVLENAPGIQIEAENMSERTPGQPVSRNRNHHYWEIFKNNYIAEEFEGKEGLARIDVKAKSRSLSDSPPVMRVVLNGHMLTDTEVREPFWHKYRFDTILKDGKNKLEIWLINNPEDAYNHRYLSVDWVRITTGPVPEQ